MVNSIGEWTFCYAHGLYDDLSSQMERVFEAAVSEMWYGLFRCSTASFSIEMPF